MYLISKDSKIHEKAKKKSKNDKKLLKEKKIPANTIIYIFFF